MSFSGSPEYAKALAIRETVVNRRLFFARGVDKAETARVTERKEPHTNDDDPSPESAPEYQL